MDLIISKLLSLAYHARANCAFIIYQIPIGSDSVIISFLQPVWNEWGNYGTDLFGEKAVDIVNAHNTSKPMFMYLAHQAVHNANPNQLIQAPEDVIKNFSYIQNERRRIFAAMATVLDQSVGKVSIEKIFF